MNKRALTPHPAAINKKAAHCLTPFFSIAELGNSLILYIYISNFSFQQVKNVPHNLPSSHELNYFWVQHGKKRKFQTSVLSGTTGKKEEGHFGTSPNNRDTSTASHMISVLWTTPRFQEMGTGELVLRICLKTHKQPWPMWLSCSIVLVAVSVLFPSGHKPRLRVQF